MGHFAQFATLVLRLSSASVDVSGDSTCPHPREVSAQLEAFRPATSAAALRALVENKGATGVSVELRNEHGALVGSGMLPVNESCDALANAAAVMIVAWQAHLAAPASVPKLPRTPVREPLVAPSLSTRAVPTETGWRFEVSAAPALVFGGGKAAFAGRVAGNVGPAASRWSGVLAFTAQTWRDLSVGAGVGQWLRTAVQLGPSLAVVKSPVRFQLGVFGLGSLLAVQGKGFDSNKASSSFELGAGASATAAIPAGSWVPFWAVSTSYWPGPQKLAVDGSSQSTMVPQLEVSVALGIGWKWP